MQEPQSVFTLQHPQPNQSGDVGPLVHVFSTFENSLRVSLQRGSTVVEATLEVETHEGRSFMKINLFPQRR